MFCVFSVINDSKEEAVTGLQSLDSDETSDINTSGWRVFTEPQSCEVVQMKHVFLNEAHLFEVCAALSPEFMCNLYDSICTSSI